MDVPLNSPYPVALANPGDIRVKVGTKVGVKPEKSR